MIPEGKHIDSPDYPDPGQTAQQQAQYNQGTAMQNQLLNFVNQRTPYGNLTYKPTGFYEYKDPATGKMVKVPSFTANTRLTPEQQRLLQQSQKFDKITNQIGIRQAHKIGDLLGTPFRLNNEATEARLMELGSKRLDPMFAQREDQLRQSLQNRGIAEGSEAWKRAYDTFSNSRNDAYNQLLLTGRGQAINELLTKRNQPINEITALMAGGQVQQPSFVNTPTTNVQPVDYSGLQNAAYNAKSNQYNGMMGGLAGLGSAAIGGWAMSDERSKKNIKKVGKLNDGTPIHAFKYKKKFGGGLMQLGALAGEVEKKHPHAVAKTKSGMKAVNYSRLAEEAARDR